MIDSQASRRDQMPQAPPRRPPRRRGGRRRRPLLEEPPVAPVVESRGARAQDPLGRHRARGGRDLRRRQRRRDQAADAARRDGDPDPDAHRRDDRGARRGARPQGRDRQRRRGGGRGARLRRRRRRPRRPPARGHDHGPRRPRQDLAAGRDPRDRGRRRRGRRDHPAHRRLPGAPERQDDQLHRHPGPRRVHRDARPRRRRHRHRRDRRRRRRRRDAADGRGDRPRQGRRRADARRGQQDRPRRAPTPTRSRASSPTQGLNPEDWGGDTIFVNVSAKTQGEPRRPAREHPAARRGRGAEGQPGRAAPRAR